MIPRMTVITLAVSLVVPAPAHGQRLRLVPDSPATRARTVPPSWRLMEATTALRTIPRTYWLEGALIGAIGLGTFTAIGFHDLCESHESCMVGGGVLGGAVGFTIGALVGGQFRKASRDSS